MDKRQTLPEIMSNGTNQVAAHATLPDDQGVTIRVERWFYWDKTQRKAGCTFSYGIIAIDGGLVQPNQSSYGSPYVVMLLDIEHQYGLDPNAVIWQQACIDCFATDGLRSRVGSVRCGQCAMEVAK